LTKEDVMPDIDIDRLRWISRGAQRKLVAEQEKKKKREAEESRLQAERKQQQEAERVQNTINAIPGTAEMAAERGETSAEVMDVDDCYIIEDPERPRFTNAEKWEEYFRTHPLPGLCGPAKVVWDWCDQAGLSPTLYYQPSYIDAAGSQCNSNSSISIHW
jgi:hypothetical protein